MPRFLARASQCLADSLDNRVEFQVLEQQKPVWMPASTMPFSEGVARWA